MPRPLTIDHRKVYICFNLMQHQYSPCCQFKHLPSSLLIVVYFQQSELTATQYLLWYNLDFQCGLSILYPIYSYRRLNFQTCSTKTQPFTNHLNNPAPSQSLAPTSPKSYQMFFQNVTHLLSISNIINLSAD